LRSKGLYYYSTNRTSPKASFREALLKGLAPDGGLYLPHEYPAVEKEELENFSRLKYHEIAFSILDKIVGHDIDGTELLGICSDAYNFDVPLENVYDRKYIMRLDNGPTASFKDFAARMMSRLMQYYLSIENQHLTILTATSGDTGSAVASAFYGLKNITVIILFPLNEVTAMQRKQMTTLDDNIKVIALDGKFDDCQKLVKEAFLDNSLLHIPLSSANSINIGRLMPQSVYYFYAWSRLSKGINDKAIFSVPSGNFGNLMGGLIAREMGLPVSKFIISTNMNNEVPEFIRTGNYKSITPSRNCISSAMNVGHPSNLARIVALYGGRMNEAGLIIEEPDLKRMRSDLYAISVSDPETREVIAEIYRKYNIILEPHGAIAWKAINEYSGSESSDSDQLFISLETAHPAKFSEEIQKTIKINPPLPPSLKDIENKPERYVAMDNDFNKLKSFILDNYK
jgi:threonine synthase